MITYKNVTLVKSSDGDWEGLYIDSELYCENHSVEVQDVLDLINNHHLKEAFSFEVSCDWLIDEMGGLLPHSLSDIPEGARV